MSACVWDDSQRIPGASQGRHPQPHHHGNPITHPLGTEGVGPGRCKAGDSSYRTQSSANTWEHGSRCLSGLPQSGLQALVAPSRPPPPEHYTLPNTVILTSLPCPAWPSEANSRWLELCHRLCLLCDIMGRRWESALTLMGAVGVPRVLDPQVWTSAPLHSAGLRLVPAHLSTFALNMPSRKMLPPQNLLLPGPLGLSL